MTGHARFSLPWVHTGGVGRVSGENAPTFFRLEKFLPPYSDRLSLESFEKPRESRSFSLSFSFPSPSLSFRTSVRRSSIAGGYPVNHVASSPLNFGFDAIGPLLAIMWNDRVFRSRVFSLFETTAYPNRSPSVSNLARIERLSTFVIIPSFISKNARTFSC